MFKPKVLANSLAILMGGLFLAFYILGLISPSLFRLFFNAQFLGADVADLMPVQMSGAEFLSNLVLLVASSWGFGYLWGILYNRLAK